MKTVSILSGMGLAATVLVMQKIMAATPAQDNSGHVPLLADQNTQVPSRLRQLLDHQSDDQGLVLAAMTARLQGAGAQALAMRCNTAHPTPMQVARGPAAFNAATGWTIEWRQFGSVTDMIAAIAAGDAQMAELRS